MLTFFEKFGFFIHGWKWVIYPGQTLRYSMNCPPPLLGPTGCCRGVIIVQLEVNNAVTEYHSLSVIMVVGYIHVCFLRSGGCAWMEVRALRTSSLW